MMLLWITFAVGVAVLIGLALWQLMVSITGMGGGRTGDADAMTTQAVAQLQAFSGKRSEERPTWDGRERMKGFQGNGGAVGG